MLSKLKKPEKDVEILTCLVDSTQPGDAKEKVIVKDIHVKYRSTTATTEQLQDALDSFGFNDSPYLDPLIRGAIGAKGQPRSLISFVRTHREYGKLQFGASLIHYDPRFAFFVISKKNTVIGWEDPERLPDRWFYDMMRRKWEAFSGILLSQIESMRGDLIGNMEMIARARKLMREDLKDPEWKKNAWSLLPKHPSIDVIKFLDERQGFLQMMMIDLFNELRRSVRSVAIYKHLHRIEKMEDMPTTPTKETSELPRRQPSVQTSSVIPRLYEMHMGDTFVGSDGRTS